MLDLQRQRQRLRAASEEIPVMATAPVFSSLKNMKTILTLA
jgi:hypothetical protein